METDLQGTHTTTAPPPGRGAAALAAAARGICLFLGGFTVVNLLGELRFPGFDATLWWIDTRPLPEAMSRLLLGMAAVLLVMYAVRPVMGRLRAAGTLAAVALLLTLTVSNAVVFYLLVTAHFIRAAVPMPVSAWLALALLLVLVVLVQPSMRAVHVRRRHLLFALLCCLVGFPLVQIFVFGYTDYRRRADVIVVFGAGVFADGTPSNALRDRVVAACALYQQGYAKHLLFSGGPGEGPVHETACMREMALRRGVPASAILVDEYGLNTHATVRNSLPIFARLHASRVIAVSHFYHLPRIKMAYARAGWNVYTVPVYDQQQRDSIPFMVLREVAGLWAYYLSPLWERSG